MSGRDLRLVIGIIALLLVLMMVVASLFPPPAPYPCDYYKDWAMKDIPARCMQHFQGNK